MCYQCDEKYQQFMTELLLAEEANLISHALISRSPKSNQIGRIFVFFKEPVKDRRRIHLFTEKVSRMIDHLTQTYPKLSLDINHNQNEVAISKRLMIRYSYDLRENE